MQVLLDDTTVDVPAPACLGELLDGLVPHIDPSRMVVDVLLDGRSVDCTDAAALATARLAGGETVVVRTDTPLGLASAQRTKLAGYMAHIANQLEVAASGFRRGDTENGNRLLAEGSNALKLALELDQNLTLLDAGASRCAAVVQVLERIGVRLTEAERDQRWNDLAALLAEELVPAIRASA